MEDILNSYRKEVDVNEVNATLKKIKEESKALYSTENLKKIFNLLDLTSLNTTDNQQVAEEMTEKVNEFQNKFPNMPNVAAICVYPTLVEVVREILEKDDVKIASVTAGFPSSQTFLSIKVVESKMAVDKGADEIDIVISVGTYLAGDLKEMLTEIGVIKEAVQDVHVKVILETGALPSLQDVRFASLFSMEGGADFIKTSTGKMSPAATPEAVFVMTEAIKDYYESTGKKIGIKPAGGVATVEDALFYYSIVKHNLGEEWLNNNLFRIGASRLANNILSEIVKIETGKKMDVDYF